jgi:hypothetical protein
MKKNKYIQTSTADDKFLSMHENICAKMPGIAALASLAPEVVILQAMTDDYSLKYTASLGGTRAQAAAKNASKLVLGTQSKVVCDGVNRIAKNNLAILLETGYPIGEGNTGPVELMPIKSLKVTNGKTLGQVIAKAVAGKGTAYILMEYGIGDTLDAVTTWTACPDTSTTCIISGLTSGTRIWIRATAVGRRGQKLPALPVNTIVL